MKSLAVLGSGDPILEQLGLPDVEVDGLTADSRDVRSGWLFVAVRGTQVDGHAYITEAVQRGAVAVLGEQEGLAPSVPYVRSENPRQALAHLAAAWHGHPGRSLVVVGVTGTDGKTTTATFIHRILLSAGYRAGLVTTVGALIGDLEEDTGFHVTTPDPMAVQGYLRRMVDRGLTHVVLETTSHGLAQHRVDAIPFDVAVVTNVTHEHLDFHGSYEAYRAAKARLLRLTEQAPKKENGPDKVGILNADDEGAMALANGVSLRCLTYGVREGADFRATDLQMTRDGVSCQVRQQGQNVRLHSRLAGHYNVANMMAAFGAAVAGLGISASDAARGIAEVAYVPGRMEEIRCGQSFRAIVDFAHTPNALDRALDSAREMTRRRVIAVFGSAGLRDRAKRRMMAEISARRADLIVLTAEDPRTEPLSAILSEMAEAAEEAGAREGKNLWRIPDRGEALRKAISLARPGDLVIACGKGHEQSMCFGELEYTWDDRTAMRAALAERMGTEGPDMPALPTSSPSYHQELKDMDNAAVDR